MDHLTYHAETVGDRIAVIDDRPEVPVRRINYASFNTLVNQLTNGLLELGAVLGSHIAWWGNNSLETLAAMHAIRKAGGVSVPIPYRSTPAKLRTCWPMQMHVSSSLKQHTFLCFLPSEDNLPALQHVITYGGTEQYSGVMLWEDALGKVQTPTSEGKAEKCPHNDLHVGDNWKIRKAPCGVLEGKSTSMGLFWNLSVGTRWKNLSFLPQGPSTTLALLDLPAEPSSSAPQLSANTRSIQKTGSVSLIRIVFLRHFLPLPRFAGSLPCRKKPRDTYDVSSMQSMIANAAPWTMALKKAYLRDFPPDSLWEIYGSTELSVCTVLAPEDQLRKPGSCGLPSPGVEIQLIDDEGQIIDQPDTPGELYARSVALFDTYYKAEEKYLEDHLDGFQTVGDIAYKDTDGYFYICDRKKDMIITGGVNVYPAEIENVLDEHPKVHEVAVVGVADEEWGEVVSAIVVRNGECSPKS